MSYYLPIVDYLLIHPSQNMSRIFRKVFLFYFFGERVCSEVIIAIQNVTNNKNILTKQKIEGFVTFLIFLFTKAHEVEVEETLAPTHKLRTRTVEVHHFTENGLCGVPVPRHVERGHEPGTAKDFAGIETNKRFNFKIVFVF